MNNVPRGLWDTGGMIREGQTQNCKTAMWMMYTVLAETLEVGGRLASESQGKKVCPIDVCNSLKLAESAALCVIQGFPRAVGPAPVPTR